MAFTFNYPANPYYKSQGTIVDIQPVYNTLPIPVGAVFTINPLLPNSGIPNKFRLDASNGNITGLTTFADVFPLTTFTVTATYNLGMGGTQITNATLILSVGIPPNFYYPNTPYILEQNIDISINPFYVVPNFAGTVYTVSGNALPAGLLLNSTNGIITGAPTVLSSAQVYNIQATNSNLFYVAPLNISIQTKPYFNYPQPSYTITQGIPITIAVETLPPGNITYATVSKSDSKYCYYPALPFGLSLNTTNGTISGTPTVLSPFRTYTISATNPNTGTTYTDINLNVIKVYLGARAVTDTTSLTEPNNAMRLKAEILQYNKNKADLTKNQVLSQIIKGNGRFAKRVWANQNIINSNPNTSGLDLQGNTLLCPGPAVVCKPTSSSNVPGPTMMLCYNPALPFVGYNSPNRVYTNLGTKWPQKAWQVGDMGFSVGKAGSDQN
jgi:hypothetical protein